MKKILFTEEFCQPENLHPFTLTRQIQDIRVGILTIREKWEKIMKLPSFDRREDGYKDGAKARSVEEVASDGPCYMIHGNVLPSKELVIAIRKLKDGEVLVTEAGGSIAYLINAGNIISSFKIKAGKAIVYKGEVKTIRYPWDIFQLNDWAIREDYLLLTRGRRTQKLTSGNKSVGAAQIFIEKGAKVAFSIINASAGPVYIGKDAEIMEGCFIRGPFAMNEKACLKMGTKVYGATTLGPHCVVGGEIKNSVLLGYSNKAHDGYLGDSVIGEWCNLGAGTTNSNIKNNASPVSVAMPEGVINAGLKCGVLMGDYSKTAVNTAINTGTVIGVSCNVFGAGLTPKFIPNFSWGSEGIQRYALEKAVPDIEDWKNLKGKKMTEEEKRILKYIFENL